MFSHYCKFEDLFIDDDGRKFVTMFVLRCPREGCRHAAAAESTVAFKYCPEHKDDLVYAPTKAERARALAENRTPDTYRQYYADDLQDGECCAACRRIGLYEEPAAEEPPAEQLALGL